METEWIRHTLHFLHSWVWMTDIQGAVKAQMGVASKSIGLIPSRNKEYLATEF